MKTEISKAEREEARLTAYVLGELDSDETKAVEALLEKSPETRESVEEIRSTADLLAAEFLKEPSLSLREEQVEAITADRGEEKVVRGRFMPLLAVAACASLFAAVGMKQYLAGLEQRDYDYADRRVEEEQVAADTASAAAPVAAAEAAKLREPAEEAQGEEADLALAPAEAELADLVKNSPGDKDAGGKEYLDTTAAPEPMEEGKALLSADDGSAAAGGAPPSNFAQRKLDADPSDRLMEKKAAPSPTRAQPGAGVAKPEPAPEPAPDAAKPSAELPAPAQAPASRGAVRLKEEKSVEGARARSKAANELAPKSRAAESKAKDDRRRKGGTVAIDEAPETLAATADMEESEEQRVRQSEHLSKRKPQKEPDAEGGESYGALIDNPWVAAWGDGKSTFAIDVDTGSYPNVRRFLKRSAKLPPKDAVRIEEMINYFNYDYPEPEGDVPFSVNLEMASCPWAKDHRLLRIGLKGRGVDIDKRPPSNLVFLIDVSGSMRGADKIDLLKSSMKKMVGQLNENDRIGIVTYAGSSGVALAPTHGDLRDKITAALDNLQSGGSTNGAAGIATAYSLAKANFVEGGTNRVILATDGDFNVGVTDNGDLIQMVEQHAGQKIFLTVLGFGGGNLQEDRMEQIADKGNGSYHYIDSEKEGEKVLVTGLGATLVTVAKDVKLQVEFNPAKVEKYRLIGYANRMMPDEAFNDRTADAGEIGAGHTATALYEIVPTKDGAVIDGVAKGGTRYFQGAELIKSPEMLAVNLKYKLPEAAKDDEGEEAIIVPLVDAGKQWPETGEDFRFAAAVAGFGLLLRDSDHAGMLNYDLVLELGGEGLPEGGDKLGLRSEFMDLVKAAKSLSPAKE